MSSTHLHISKALSVCCIVSIVSVFCGNLSAGSEILLTPATVAGHIEDRRIIECSGLETSPAQPDLLWAINDGGNGPYIYALGGDGRHRGRYRIKGAVNRDWEGIDAFQWNNHSYLLIADFGDNHRVHTVHHLYFIREPLLDPANDAQEVVVPLERQILFNYPDGGHDAEGVAVDTRQKKILFVTKRDAPPLIFELPLFPSPEDHPITVKLVGSLNHLQQPTPQDLTHSYGDSRSHPTALDISNDGQKLALLTYKHAYILSRSPSETWATALTQIPQLIPLPLPENTSDLRQREAICFKNPTNPVAILVTSEGIGAGIYHIAIPSK